MPWNTVGAFAVTINVGSAVRAARAATAGGDRSRTRTGLTAAPSLMMDLPATKRKGEPAEGPSFIIMLSMLVGAGLVVLGGKRGPL